MTSMTPNPRDQILLEAERDLLLEQLGYLDIRIAARHMMISEGAITGSMGGHDPDFAKLHGGLMKFWIEKAHKDPHPFAYCVRHLRKHVANPERLCAWLKDQALGTTKWRKGNHTIGESDLWSPSIEELQGAVKAYEEAFEDLDESNDGGESGGSSTDAGGSGDDAPPAGGDAGTAAAKAGEPGSTDDPGAEPPAALDDEE